MIEIENIFEQEKILKILEKKDILFQYKKAKRKILSWVNSKSLDLKFRKPKADGIISFRINNQFRAFCFLRWSDLIIYEINNHQN